MPINCVKVLISMSLNSTEAKDRFFFNYVKHREKSYLYMCTSGTYPVCA